MNRARGVISFASCGAVSTVDVGLLAAHAGKLLSVRPEVVPQPLDLPVEAFNPQRGQYHAGVILQYLAVQLPEYARIVGITSRDLFLPIFTHVYGEAQMPGRAAVVSVCRLDAPAPPHGEDRGRTFARALKVTVHELLHTFELTHCLHSECLMQPVTGVAQLDALPLKLCRSCRNFWEDAAGGLHLA